MGRTMPVGLRGDRPLLQRWKTANRWRNRSHVTIRLRTLPGNKIKRIPLGGDAKPIRRPLLLKVGAPARDNLPGRKRITNKLAAAAAGGRHYM